jgi:hypothetical protein
LQSSGASNTAYLAAFGSVLPSPPAFEPIAPQTP